MSGGPESNDDPIVRIVSLRLAVGLLGERDGATWWSSGFMAPTSNAFLTPVFGSRVLQAQYQGVLEAARRTHDSCIGVGRVFHPFRLPEVVEQRAFDAVQAHAESFAGVISSLDAARSTLMALAGEPVAPRPGPSLIGTPDRLDEVGWVSEVASVYSAAFANDIQTFPYFAGNK